MAFDFNTALCRNCPFGVCIEDRRNLPVRGRSTRFRLKQNTALACTFDHFVPGTDNDPEPFRSFAVYLTRFRKNALEAGKTLFGRPFGIRGAALAKVEGDVNELIEAACLWNAIVIWNSFMDTGVWGSNVFSKPPGSAPSPSRKVAVLRLPRGYNPMNLFREDVRSSIQAHEAALKLRGMELGLSSPDLVGIRVPDPMPAEYLPFLKSLDNLDDSNRLLLESAYHNVEGTLVGRSFLFAIAVKRTTRSDRLYQPLFEANVLKYLIEFVLRGAAFRFNVHLGSFEGAAVKEHYKAASLVSLLLGGEPRLAVDRLLLAERPAETAQSILNDLPLFPL